MNVALQLCFILQEGEDYQIAFLAIGEIKKSKNSASTRLFKKKKNLPTQV